MDKTIQLPDITIKNGRIITSGDLQTSKSAEYKEYQNKDKYPVKEMHIANIQTGKIFFCLIFALTFGPAGIGGIILVSATLDAPLWVYIELLAFGIVGIAFLFAVLKDIILYVASKSAPEREGIVVGYEDNPHFTINGRPAQILRIKTIIDGKTVMLKISTDSTLKPFKPQQQIGVRIFKKRCVVFPLT